ncbi:kinase [Cytobacillus sp. FSL W7-1323]|uniref:Kinase n=1 Tax=Cytobacillus kochii TaxID=859143 RepID=A0A248TIE3_9BACI|nr:MULTISPECIES: kinase [Cytobacillus]ASV67941.1 kinase [Cytobacillus kochii]MDQ0186040.1 L-threonine kinase [Cytobacillus kochii]MEA1853789.1 kinase [Cytobacillus sp. OWB-43]MED1605730.1 kinase [Cytobacillus kochii]
MIKEAKMVCDNEVITGVGRACGTFGEFLQGILPDNQEFLVTFPINRFSTCYFNSSPSAQELEVFPPHKKKTRQLAINILSYFNLPTGGRLEIDSELVEGKGLASSTADMVAAIRAIEDCYPIKIPIYLLEEMMRRIEPSDGIMYEGVVSYYHREVKIRGNFGSCPPLTVLAIDEGGVVDTIEFNHQIKPFDQKEKVEYERLLQQAEGAIVVGDVNLLGQVATRSTEMNQKVRPKLLIDKMKRINQEIGGVGIVTAHSGTYIGVLLSDTDPNYIDKLKKGIEKFKSFGLSAEVFHSLPSTREGGGWLW